MSYGDFLKLTQREECDNFLILHTKALQNQQMGNVDQFYSLIQQAAECAETIHQYMGWDQTNEIFKNVVAKERSAHHIFGSKDFYDHIHMQQVLICYFLKGMEEYRQYVSQERDKERRDIIKNISQLSEKCKTYSASRFHHASDSLDRIYSLFAGFLNKEKDMEALMAKQHILKECVNNSQPSAAVFPGVITLLDVLGWKGIYQRQTDAITKLQEIITLLRRNVQKYGFGVDGLLDTQVLSISDTIVISTQCVNNDIYYRLGIECHGYLCSDILLKAFEKGIPLRGAVCCGEYAMMDNIFVGPAVDEAASWHELADWMGVHMTPSATCVYHNAASEGCPVSSRWTMWEVVLKNRSKLEVPCLKWTLDGGNEVVDTLAYRKILRTRTPISPEVSNKYEQTCAFLEHVEKLHSQEKSSADQKEDPNSP